MKKQIVAISLCLLAVATLNAQKTSFGLKGGLNISDVSNINGDNRLSGHLGLYFNSRLNAQWSIQPELLYSGQGQQYRVFNNEVTLALNYLQIPMMFQFRPLKQVYLEVGPQLGFLLAANVKDDDDKNEVDDNYKKTDLGLNFGAGFMATQRLGFYARYCIGLSDINDAPIIGDLYNRVGQIGLFIRLQ
jgi:hypothetical protein